jgi:CRP-like cAMP-binding protein
MNCGNSTRTKPHLEETTMTASNASPKLQTRFEDVLAHLPASRTTAYRKGQMIYGPNLVSNSTYLVLTGKVGISQTAENGSELLLEIVRPDELFGEWAFLDVPHPFERATAI